MLSSRKEGLKLKIILIGLASIYTEGLTYQDNLLADQLRADGNDVTLVVECFKYEDGRIIEVDEEDVILKNGIRLIRKKYRNIFGSFISGKVRAIIGLEELLTKLEPDIVFHHSLQTFEMLTIKKYKKKHPKVKFFVDSHEDFHNSATNFLSKYFLHRIFYKVIISLTVNYIDKIFCVSYESFDFLENMYNIKREKMKFFPLGGKVMSDEEYCSNRTLMRYELGILEDDILIIHSGKMDLNKKTNQLLNAFSNIKSSCLKLVIIGTFDVDSLRLNDHLIKKDNRITYLGWKSGNELVKYLCAADLYVQPGSQSVTMQIAACCRSALAIYPYPSHKYLMGESVFYIESEKDINSLLFTILENRDLLEKKRFESIEIANEKLNYKVLANQLYF